jgi:2-C-methyl-D-erythritol 2,4-cyclodiphosphate synthase
MTQGQSGTDDSQMEMGQTQTSAPMSVQRVGFGYDVHRLVEGRPLILGGVQVPFDKGLEGHSDGDALLHALADALLGAAGLGDIGAYFPSSDPGLQGISSVEILAQVTSKLRENGWRIENVDGTILAQRPRLAPHTPNMRALIAETLGIEEDRADVKSKTTDGLGFTGAGEGMAAYCVAMIARAEGLTP